MAPKSVPVTVIESPTAPEVGLRLVMCEATVKAKPLLAKPPTVTTTLPLVAPDGTGTVMLVPLHELGVAAVPLNVTVLVPCDAPKLVPLITTDWPAGEIPGEMPMIFGETPNEKPLLARPLTETTTEPLVALGTGTMMLMSDQLVGVAAVPLKVTVLLPCVAPKFVPLIVTVSPIGAAAGLMLETFGPTKNATPLLASPPTVTTTLPLVAPAGTGTAIEVLDQLVGAAVVPLKVTVLVP